MRYAAAIPDDKQALVLGLEVLVYGDLHVVEFDLHAVKQRVVVGGTRCNFIKGIDHLDNTVQDPLWHDQTEIARCSGESRRDERLGQPLVGRALSADEISEPLYHDTAAQHVGKPRNTLAVAVAVLERLGKMLGDEQREICVAGLLGRIFIAVAVDGHDAVRVLGDDRALRVHAEGADQVLVFLGLVDDFALVELVRDVLEHFGGKLDPHADVHTVRHGRDVQILTHRLHPLAAAAADRDDALLPCIAAFVGDDLISAVHNAYLADRRQEMEVDFLPEIVVKVRQHLVVDVRSEMAHGCLQQMEVVPQALRFKCGIGG